jgi:hypothetical protein
MSDPKDIENRELYKAFVPVLEGTLGNKAEKVIHAIIGFEFGGPPDLLLFPNPPGIKGIFYVTSDLLFFDRQPENSLGRYEVAICLPKESDWAKQVLYKLSQATVEEAFDVGHTADITAWVSPDCPIKGLLFTKLVSFEFHEQPFGALLCIGITRAELDYAIEHGSEKLLTLLETAGVFPVTNTERSSVI